MNPLISLSSLILALSLSGILLVFVFNPFLIWVLLKVRGRRPVKTASIQPSVSLIIVVRNAEELIADKVRNSISLDYPSDEYEIIIFSDGSTDKTEEIVKPFVGDKVRLLSSEAHEGKNSGINKAVESSCGEILVFSDGDARLEKEAIMHLVKYFADSGVGGVFGKRLIYNDERDMTGAQSIYIDFDRNIKYLESLTGSVTSNDGKISAIRRSLFQNLPFAVTDDLFIGLSVIRQGYRLLFEPRAIAYIHTPSRTVAHELKRRRRIVSTSLRGICMMREVLNPFSFGSISIRLFINKIMRRMLPISLLFLFLSSLLLSFHYGVIKVLLVMQIGFYIIGFFYWLFLQNLKEKSLLTKLSSVAFYFCLGNIGTFLGLIDFFLGKKTVEWEPFKKCND